MEHPQRIDQNINFKEIVDFVFNNFTNLNNAISFNVDNFCYTINRSQDGIYSFNKFPVNNNIIIVNDNYNDEDIRKVNLYLKFRLPHLIFNQINDKISQNSNFTTKTQNVDINGFDGKKYNQKTSLLYKEQELMQFLAKIENGIFKEYDKITSCDFLKEIEVPELYLINLLIDKDRNKDINFNEDHNQQLFQIYKNIGDETVERDLFDNKSLNIEKKELPIKLNNKKYEIYKINDEILILVNSNNMPLSHKDSNELISKELDKIISQFKLLENKINNNQIISQDEKLLIKNLDIIDVLNPIEANKIRAKIIDVKIKPLQDKIIKNQNLTFEEQIILSKNIDTLSTLNPLQAKEIRDQIKASGDNLIANFTQQFNRQLEALKNNLFIIDKLIPDYDSSNILQNKILSIYQKIEIERNDNEIITKEAISELAKINKDWSKLLQDNLSNQNNNLIELDFRKEKINKNEINAVVKSLASHNGNIYKLGLGANNLDPNIVKEIATIMITNQYNNLIGLCIGNNNLDHESIKLISDSLTSDNSKLKSLCLSGNKIGINEIKSITNALTDPKNKLAELGIGNSNIGDDEIKLIANSLIDKNNNLIELNIEDNQITFEGMKLLANAICHKNSKLIWLNIKGNKINEETVDVFTNILSNKNCKIEKFLIDDIYQSRCNEAINSRHNVISTNIMIPKESSIKITSQQQLKSIASQGMKSKEECLIF